MYDKIRGKDSCANYLKRFDIHKTDILSYCQRSNTYCCLLFTLQFTVPENILVTGLQIFTKYLLYTTVFIYNPTFAMVIRKLCLWTLPANIIASNQTTHQYTTAILVTVIFTVCTVNRFIYSKHILFYIHRFKYNNYFLRLLIFDLFRSRLFILPQTFRIFVTYIRANFLYRRAI